MPSSPYMGEYLFVSEGEKASERNHVCSLRFRLNGLRMPQYQRRRTVCRSPRFYSFRGKGFLLIDSVEALLSDIIEVIISS